MAVTANGDTLRFVINNPQGNLDILPCSRYVNLIFRDVRSAKAQINGVEVPFSHAGIPLLIDPAEEYVVELTEVRADENRPKDILRTNLLTRIQGEVIWKNVVLNSEKKMPQYVRDALAELDALEY
jgi:hypothetical protein